MTEWRKASRSNTTGGDCVELAAFPGRVAVRDSKNPEAGAYALPREAFASLVDQIKAGALDMR